MPSISRCSKIALESSSEIMAKINYEYCEEKVLYDSGAIEEELLKEYKAKNIPSATDSRYFYALTPIRENIINWYPFKKGSTILEVGGGLGSITGSLCEKAGKVVSCEYSKRRAENIYWRHKDRDNLEVIVGDLNKVEFEEKFDYIVLIGVFEYAKRFCNSNNPFVDFLKNLKKNLKKNGVILIAIENRYGIKYWAGSEEDHYPEKYLGLKNYNDRDIQTMGKQELIDVFSEAEIDCYRFYYPYPDYKMPYIITTDEREFDKTEFSSLRIYNHGEQSYNFDYRNVLPGIIENKMYGFFANSFLIELSMSNKNFSDVSYVKTNWERNQEYQVNTIIKNNNKINKVPKTIEACKHLDNMITTHKMISDLGQPVSKITKIKNAYEVEYIEGTILTEYIQNSVIKKDRDSIIAELDKYYELLKSLSRTGKLKKHANEQVKQYYEKTEVEILKIGLIDLHFSNIIKNNDLYTVIDQEWVSKYDIPLKYMLYFSIRYLFAWVEGFETLFEMNKLFEKYGISEEETQIFNTMSIDISCDELKTINNEITKMVEAQNQLVFVDEKITKLKEEVLECQTLISEQQAELTTLSDNLEKSETMLNGILNSKKWIYANKIANIKAKLINRK